MAVEALRQLGGMFNNVVQEQDLPMLPCNLCDTKFHTTADLHAHFALCKTNKLICSSCQEIIDTKQDYDSHRCFLQELSICKFCNQNFFNKIDLDAHVELLHITPERTYKCHICNLTFVRATSLKNHLKIHTYVPGRAIGSFDQETTEPDELKWTNDLVYVDKNCIDSLNNFNYGTATSLVQTELNADINLIGQEMVVNTTYDDTSNNQSEKSLDYPYQNDLYNNSQIKMENYLSEVDKMDETFPISSLPQMEVTIDGKRPHICSHCGATFTRAKALTSHLKLHLIGLQNKYECETCGESFENDILKLAHKGNCFVNNTLLMTELKELSSNNDDKLNIKKVDDKNFGKIGKHCCPECQKRFTTKQKMFRHMWIHRKKTFSCEVCSLTFEIQTDLDKHRLTQHPTDSPYVCQECGKCFASRQGLWEHGRVHGTGTAGLFQCTTCSKTFASRQGYLIHNRTHTGERPYGCRFCIKAFRDGGTLRKHERIHTGERPHVCPICLHDFNQKVVLREHVRWVHVASKVEDSEGFFDCQLCKVTIKDKEELCAHIVRHSDQMAAQVKGATTKFDGKLNVKIKRTQKKLSKQTVIKKEMVDNLQGDININFEMQNFECDMCGLGFTTQKELMTHVHVHI